MNNYHCATACVSVFASVAIDRLIQSKRKVTSTEEPPLNSFKIPKEQMKQFETLKELCSIKDNFARYREHLNSTGGACIPYIGVILRDITFIEDGNKSKLSK